MRGTTKADTMIICGDCGVLWHGGRRDEIQLELLEDLPFTIAFVDGNHENFTALSKYPVKEWNDGKVQFLRPHVIHFMRGQVFTLEGRTFFTMGGASSHDVEDGILDPATPDYYERLLRLLGEGRRQYRIVGQSWWPEELPSEEEYAEARRNLDTYGWEADYIITHALMAADLPQMELYCGIGRLVSDRPEKGAAVAAAEYLCATYPDASGGCGSFTAPMKTLRKCLPRP